MQEPIVILLNHIIPCGCGVGRVTGATGKSYATSKYERRYGCHVARIPLSVWQTKKQGITPSADVAQAPERLGVLGNCWEVRFEFPEHVELIIEHPASDPKPPVGDEIPQTPQIPQPVEQSDSLETLPFFTLKKRAKALGINADDYKGRKAELISAIRGIK